MPLPPPTRPHHANPHASLNPSFFPRSSTPPNGTRHTPSTSLSSLGKHETEWDDAWDSSSDRDDKEDADSLPRRSSSSARPFRPVSRGAASSSTVTTPPVTFGGGSQAIPIKKASPTAPISAVIGEQDSSANAAAAAGGSASSWSSSFQHIPTRPELSTSKTYTEGATPPAPGTAVNGSQHRKSSSVKLPPGGAWELVDPVDVVEPLVTEEQGLPVGKEAVRADVEDIMRDPLQLLSSLSFSPSVPPSPATAPTPSKFPFLVSSPLTTPSRTPLASVQAATPSSSSSTFSPPGDHSGGAIPRLKREFGRQRSVRTERRREKFAKVLRGRVEDGGGVEVAELRRLSWSGIPDEVRPIAWQLLLNYLPLPAQPRLSTLSRKRKEYSSLVEQYFGRGLAALDQQIWHQIEIDVPRTRPGIVLWSCLTAQRALERILYVWAIRHPASGYVQGINDLVTPFFQVFLGAYIAQEVAAHAADTDPELFDVIHLPDGALAAIEADTFWCLSKLLDGIQDHYISHQPGIQRLVKRMSELVRRIDAPLALHFEEQGVEFMQFAFRWMNCLLMREMNVKCTIRMWDTYLAEGTDAFSQFHLYVCSALLVKYSHQLQDMDFQYAMKTSRPKPPGKKAKTKETIMFLQRLPTHSWTDHDVELLLSEAYVLKTVWQGAENHFASSSAAGSGGGGFGMLGR